MNCRVHPLQLSSVAQSSEWLVARVSNGLGIVLVRSRLHSLLLWGAVQQMCVSAPAAVVSAGSHCRSSVLQLLSWPCHHHLPWFLDLLLVLVLLLEEGGLLLLPPFQCCLVLLFLLAPFPLRLGHCCWCTRQDRSCSGSQSPRYACRLHSLQASLGGMHGCNSQGCRGM